MISVTASGLAETVARLTDLETKQLPFATALALTRTAQIVKTDLESEMASVFDRPTRYTLNSLRLFPAKKARLEARVWMKDESDKAAPATTWLAPQVYGGARQDKRSETLLRARGLLPAGKYVVPGKNAKLDSNGNISRGQLQKALSGLGAQFDKYANSTTSRRSAGNLKRFFVIYKGKGASRTAIGIAERTGRGRAGVGLLLAFVGSPTYAKRLDFFGIAESVTASNFDAQFQLALQQALGSSAR